MRIELIIVMALMVMIDVSSCVCTFRAWMEWLGWRLGRTCAP